MKKFISLMLAGALLIPLNSCAPKNDDGTIPESSAETTAVSTEKVPSFADLENSLGIDIVSDVMSFNEVGAPPLTSYSAHGGNQTRVVKTSHGHYCTYITGDTEEIDGFTYYKYSLNKIDPDAKTVTVLHEGKFIGGSNSPYIMADDEENIWVACGHEMYSSRGFGLNNIIWKYDPASGLVTEYTKLVPAKNEVEIRGYGYLMSFIDSHTDTLYIVHCGGDAAGLFVILRFDMNTCEFVDKGTVFELPGRHCYLYGFGDGKGGFSIVGQRDMSVEATGFESYFKDGEYWADYVWDDLRLFSFDVNEAGELVSTGVHDVAIAEYVQESGLYPQNIHYRNGDVFVDGDGNTHFIYRSAYPSGKARITTRHVIMDKSYTVIYNEEITLDPKYHSFEIKLYQTTEGVYYIAAMPKYENLPEGELPSGNPEGVGARAAVAEVQLYRSEDGKNFTMVYKEALEGQAWIPGHITATQERNGSLRDNKLSLMISAADDWKYITVDFDAAEALYNSSENSADAENE